MSKLPGITITVGRANVATFVEELRRIATGHWRPHEDLQAKERAAEEHLLFRRQEQGGDPACILHMIPLRESEQWLVHNIVPEEKDFRVNIPRERFIALMREFYDEIVEPAAAAAGALAAMDTVALRWRDVLSPTATTAIERYLKTAEVLRDPFSIATDWVSFMAAAHEMGASRPEVSVIFSMLAQVEWLSAKDRETLAHEYQRCMWVMDVRMKGPDMD